ncbi:MAG: HAD-IC family P-type ATPase [Clostridia bacterium]|nr:HAD-IC family P-type ATPase [Clostridia bacterium]
MANNTIKREPIERINTDVNVGLTSKQAEERAAKGYANKADDPNEKSALKIIAGNLFTFFNVVLFCIAAVFLTFVIVLKAIGRSDVADSYFGFSKFMFLIPALMNVGMGSFQEIQSLKVIKKLRIVTETKCKILRDGKVITAEADKIVLDDIIYISAGDQATADLTVVSGEVFVDESMLTGEADHVKKTPGDKILSGSAIIVGEAKCRAEAVGNDTYAVQLTKKVKSGARHKSELMTTIMRIIKILTVGLGIALTSVFITLIVKISAYGADASVWGMEMALNDPVTWSLIMLTGGTFGIGMIPSGLVLTTSVALMVSIAQLTKKQTLIQELYSLENLSRVDTICLDKTGTLTDGTMTVSDVKTFISEDEVSRHARAIVASAGERNSTMEAVYKKFGIAEQPDYKEVIPFSSATKYSGLVYKDGKRLLMGAPEYLLDANDEKLKISSDYAKEGKRVVAMTLDGELIAFIAIEDHIRDTAPDTLKFFRENGVTVKVISGDNPLTVSKIAEQCGIVNADKYISLSGVPLEKIPEIAEEYTVFARVSPEQKEALVAALQSKGHKVAMTGDGVNDILALRRSDSSITFAKATEAAKSCSDVVLLDNDFSHLKEVVGEGRRVISNIQRTAVLYLMKSLAVFIFAFALIPFAKGQMWLSVENLYMLEAAVIGTGGFLLSLEPMRTPIKGSFLKNILSQSVAAGILAALSILLPIMLNTIPPHFGLAPFVSDVNVRPMMTLFLMSAGFVVIFSSCIPFNKYRAFVLVALLTVAFILGMMLPASYIGGKTIGEGMLAFDKAAGQTIFDSQLVREMFRPGNSEVIKNLIADRNNFLVIRLFFYIAVPIFVLVRFAVENFARKQYKDVKKNRAFRIGRRLMLASGFVLILHAILAAIETFTNTGSMVNISSGFTQLQGLSAFISIVFVVFHLAIGYIGYKLWKDPTKKMIKIAFISAVALLVLTVISTVLSNSFINLSSDALIMFDSIVILAITVAYIVGAIIVRSRYDLGLEKPRDK